MEGFQFPNPMDVEDIELSTDTITTDEAVRTVCLKAAVNNLKTAPAVKILAQAREFENYIRNGTVEEKLHYDDNTLLKVHEALAVGLRSGYNTTELISELQNAGILFRERVKD